MNGKTLAASVALITLLAGLVPAFAAQKQDEDQVQLGTSEVILDVIATDSKGRPITDLRADEVQVFESGDRMEMTRLRRSDRLHVVSDLHRSGLTGPHYFSPFPCITMIVCCIKAHRVSLPSRTANTSARSGRKTSGPAR